MMSDSRTNHTFVCVVFVFSACIALGCAQPRPTPLGWPDITHEMKPWSRWWWHGSSVTKAGITAELEAYQEAGLGGLELTPIYGVIGDEDNFVDYLSSEWMDLFAYTLQEAERLDLGIDMATGTGWPFGGPWVSNDDACRYLAHKTYELSSGQQLDVPVEYLQEPFVRAVTNQVYQLYGMYREAGEKVTGSMSNPALIETQRGVQIEDLVEPVAENANLQALALDQVRFPKSLPLATLVAYSGEGDVQDLTDRVDTSGILDWKAPDGSWTLYALFHGWHGKMVERAAPGGEGNVIDHFSTDPIRHYLAKFDAAFEGHNTTALRAFFNDSYEVDDARGQADWTPDLLSAFEERRGYDLRNHLLALFGMAAEDENIRVLSDYRETISDLILETFTSEWAGWAQDRGAIVRNQAHGSPANILDLYAASDIPETEGTDLIRIKSASSAAHVSGARLVSSESATWLNEHFLSSLSDIKRNLDRYYVGGVNHIFYHGTCYSPPEDPWPGRLFYASVHANPRNSLWRHFPALNSYVARTQSFLQSGVPDNDVLVYFPIYDRFATPGREFLEHFDGAVQGAEQTPVRAVAEMLQENGFTFDFISDRQLLDVQFEAGQIASGGTKYQTVVVPKCRFMPLHTMEKLKALAEEGATIIMLNGTPSDVPGLADLAERQDAMRNLLETVSAAERGRAAIGQGAFLLGDDLDQLLDRAGVPREELVDQGLEYARRKINGGTCYFISNWSGEDFDGWIPLQSGSKSVAIFDQMSGNTGFAEVRPADTDVEVRLQLSNGESFILVAYDAERSGELWSYRSVSEEVTTLNGPWSIAFVDGGPERPEDTQVTTLGLWTDLPADKARQFSGVVHYQTTFSRPAGASGHWLLDLGDVFESASIRINGEELGTLIGPVYRLTIDDAVLQDNNDLEIEVANLMANRIAAMDKAGVFWKKFYNVNFPARRRENRGANGLFDATGWEPLRSGLAGPVKLTPMQ